MCGGASGGSGEGKPPEVSLIYFLAWTNTYMLLVSCLLFWTDFVPNFGMCVLPRLGCVATTAGGMSIDTPTLCPPPTHTHACVPQGC